MKKSSTTNTFQDGLSMDFNPLVTPANVLTGCLNGTLLTYNGNENVLLNDMGNGRVETACLPEGYVPVGTTELGGIIYIVSYNPNTKKCLIGSFPSPERNCTGDEIESFAESGVLFKESDFKDKNNKITTTIVSRKLGDAVLRPGDKFIVAGDTLDEDIGSISHYYNDNFTKKYVDFKLATLDNSGRLIYLDNLRKYTISTNDTGTLKLNIKLGKIESNPGTDIEDYRDIVSSDYHIFTSNVAGNLYIVGKLEIINRITGVTWELISLSTDAHKCTIIESGKEYYIKYTINFESEEGITLNHIIHDINNKSLNPTEFIHPFKEGVELTNPFSFVVKYKANENIVIDVDIIPCMKFGILDYLKETVHIDFSLLGSSQIKNTIWKYYLEENGMDIRFDLTNYYADKQTKSVKLEFEELGTEENRIKCFNLPVKFSYNGTHTVSIPFGDIIEKDRLYKVSIISSDDSGSIGDPIIHYLYTNGVYNEYYPSPDKQDFDNEYLPLKLNADFKTVKEKIKLTSDNHLEPGSKFVTPSGLSAPDYVRGKTIYTGHDTIEWTPQLVLNEDFNTFSLDLQGVTVAIAEQSSLVSSNTHDIPSSSGDTEWIKDTDKLEDGEQIDISYSNNRLTYDIKLFSPISANTELKTLAVDNYFAPLLSTIDDAYRYGLEILKKPYTHGVEQEITVADPKLSSEVFPSFGISGGGLDNTGGGGTLYISGIASMYIEDDPANTTTYNKLITLGQADEKFGDKGDYGIYFFPNDDVTRDILKIFPSNGVVPVLLNFVGEQYIVANGVKYKLIEEQRSNKPRKSLFNAERVVKNVQFLLFFRVKDSEEFVPLDFSLRCDQLQEGALISYHVGFYSYMILLNSLYARRPYDKKIPLYAIKDFSYVNKKVTHTISSKIQYSYDPYHTLLFNGKPLYSMYPYEGTLLPACFRMDVTGGAFEADMELIFDINNNFVDDYLAYLNSVSIPSYVRGGTVLAPDDPNTSKIYIIEGDKLVEDTKFEKKANVENYIRIEKIDDQENCLTQGTSGATSYEYSNLNILAYDSRTDALCIKRENSMGTDTWKWGGQSGVRIGPHIDNYGTISKVFNKG